MFQKFICFVYNEFWSEDINFFPAKAETPYFWMMKSLCIMDQQVVAFKALKYLRKVEKSILSLDPKIVAFKLQMC